VALEVDKIEKVALALTVTLFATLTVRAVFPLKRNWAALPEPMVRLLTFMLALITTVCPLEMVTLFVLVGTPVGVQMAGLFQLPPAFDTFDCAISEGNATNPRIILANSLLLNMFSKNSRSKKAIIYT